MTILSYRPLAPAITILATALHSDHYGETTHHAPGDHTTHVTLTSTADTYDPTIAGDIVTLVISFTVTYDDGDDLGDVSDTTCVGADVVAIRHDARPTMLTVPPMPLGLITTLAAHIVSRLR